MWWLYKILILQYLIEKIVASSSADSYAPKTVQCPSGTENFLREANSISTNEKNWLSKRNKITQQNLEKFLQYTAKLNSSEYSDLLSQETIKVGLAFSGGSYRALLSGAGQISALDNKTNNAFAKGLGGLLESSSYIAGVSGGSWLVSLLALNNWISVQEILDNHKVLNIEHPVYDLEGLHLIKTYKIWKAMIAEVKEKSEAGFHPSLTDLWGIGLSRQFFPESSNYGETTYFSDIRESSAFTSGQMPFPIVISDAIFDNDTATYTESTLIETNPYEFGTWEETGNAFIDTKYLGTYLNNGKPKDTSSCVTGFDNVGFIFGTSSSIFNILIDTLKAKVEKVKLLYKLVEKLLDYIVTKHLDEAIYSPNPFYNSQYGTLDNLKKQNLTLVDGGTDGQNIPLVPLLQKDRNLDVIFTFDNTENRINYWPNGSSLIATYNRQFYSIGQNIAFPKVPSSSEEFVSHGLTKKPAFFGCSSSELQNLGHVPPLIVYVPNTEHSYLSNTSTYKLSYDDDEKYPMIQNGFETASRNNLTDDSNWQTCVGCAVIRRAQERQGALQSNECKKCFSKYCYTG